jgi:hypothetical protein
MTLRIICEYDSNCQRLHKSILRFGIRPSKPEINEAITLIGRGAGEPSFAVMGECLDDHRFAECTSLKIEAVVDGKAIADGSRKTGIARTTFVAGGRTARSRCDGGTRLRPRSRNEKCAVV